MRASLPSMHVHQICSVCTVKGQGHEIRMSQKWYGGWIGIG